MAQTNTRLFRNRAYEAALGALTWEDWALEAMRTFGGTGGVAGIVNVEQGCIERLIGVNVRAQASDDYVGGYYLSDPQAGIVQRFEGLGTYADWADLDAGLGATADYIHWHHSVARVAHHLTAVVPLDGGRRRFALCVHQGAGSDRSPFTYRRDLEAALPDLSRAADLAFSHGEALLEAYWHGSGAAHDSRAIFLLDDRGRVARLNGAAETMVRGGSGIELVQGYLCCKSAANADSLKNLIARATLNDGSAGGVARIKQVSESPDLIATCHPLPRSARGLAPSEAAALLTIISPRQLSTSCMEIARDAFRLSSRENDLATALIAGHSPGSAAAALGIEVSTVRSHLRKLLMKTGATNQVALINLIRSLS